MFGLRRIETKIDRLIAVLNCGVVTMATIQDRIDQLQMEVEATEAGIQSAIKLIDGLHSQLLEAGTAPDRLKALADSLVASRDQLAEAVMKDAPPADEPTPASETAASPSAPAPSLPADEQEGVKQP